MRRATVYENEKMKQYLDKINYILAAAFGLLFLTMFMRPLSVSGKTAGILYLIRYITESNGDITGMLAGLERFAGEVSAAAEAVAGLAVRLFVLWVISEVIYLAVGIALLFVKGRAIPFTAGIGVFLGCVLKAISFQTILRISTEFVPGLTWSMTAFAVWLLLNAVIVAGIIIYLILNRSRESSERLYHMQENIVKDGPLQGPANVRGDHFCPHCGRRIEEDSLFCAACGARIDRY